MVMDRKWQTFIAVVWSALSLHAAHGAPVEETRGNVAVLHGGIGAEARAAMEGKAAAYNLRLTFARKGSGAYLSNVRVVIRDGKGGVMVDTVASGPWLFARLPAGQYSVAATAEESTLTQTLTLQGNARRDWVFRFDAPRGDEPELNPR